MANAFFVRCDCRNRRFTGGKSRFLQEADGRKGIASAADELCGSALNRNLTPSELNQHCPHTPTQRKPMASRHRLSLCPVFPNAANACKLIRKRPPLRRNQLRRSHQLKRQPLFGRGGLGERRFSQRSGLSPRISLYRLFGREREGGASLREAASLAFAYVKLLFGRGGLGERRFS